MGKEITLIDARQSSYTRLPYPGTLGALLLDYRDAILAELLEQVPPICPPPCHLIAGGYNTIEIVIDWHCRGEVGERSLGYIALHDNRIRTYCNQSQRIINIDYCDPTMLDQLLDVIRDCLRADHGI